MIGNGELGREVQAEVTHYRTASPHRPALNENMRVGATAEKLQALRVAIDGKRG